MKATEIAFYNFMRAHGVRSQPHISGPSPRELINRPDCPVPAKQAWYYLEKWSGKRWYGWGTSLDLGWLEINAPATL